MPPPKRASRQKMLPLPISPPENAVSQQAPPQIAAGPLSFGASLFVETAVDIPFYPDILNFMNKKERENPWT